MADAQAERSRLLNKQHAEEQASLKDLKKKKGMLHDAAQKKHDELLARHAAELAEFDAAHGGGSAPVAAAPAHAAPHGAAAAAGPRKALAARAWNSDMSKKDLEEACAARGLGKKGGKEDLITRLVLYDQEHKGSAAAAAASDEESDESGDEAPQAGAKWAAAPGKATAAAKKPQAQPQQQQQQQQQAAKKSDSEEEGSDEDDDDDDDDDSSDEEGQKEMTEEEKQEAERQYKREKFLQQAIAKLLKEHDEGIDLADLAGLLIEAGALRDASNLAPEKFGYKSMEQMMRRQPEALLCYDRQRQKIFPPKAPKRSK
eukprot:m51a1_g3240 hypothetical protein (315) ;mRNA; r:125342-126286